MKENKESIWLKLKRVVRRIIILPQRGDGGLFSEKYIQVTKPQQDTTLIQKDTIVAKPRN
jgi:hypothetical protein